MSFLETEKEVSPLGILRRRVFACAFEGLALASDKNVELYGVGMVGRGKIEGLGNGAPAQETCDVA